MLMTIDGNTAAALVAYAFSEIACIYPITPSSTMAELVDEWAAHNKKNLFDQVVEVVELQSEAGAAGSLHGALKAGVLTSTFTASQGLLLMIPNMYKIAGELLPTVFHVAARALTTNALNIFGDHSDVMATRQTGFAMLAEGSVQEVMDLSAVAHLSTITSSVPFLNFFDGFRTSHEIQKIEAIAYDDLKQLVDQKAIDSFRTRQMSPNHPNVSGTNQNADLYFQQREVVNQSYDKVFDTVRKYMKEINQLRGTDYDLVNYYGVVDATEVIIAMGSVTQTIEQTVDYLNQNGCKVGYINIRLYRPFPKEALLDTLPQSVTNIAVLDRTKEPGSIGEPLLLDVQSSFYGKEGAPFIIGGRYGIGSKDVRPKSILAVFAELQKPISKQKERFTLGIIDDLTYTNLKEGESLDLTPKNAIQAMFWGIGSDGTVGANKSSIKIIGENTEKFCQAYFDYDSKKAGGRTTSHLRFGDTPIHSSYLIESCDYVTCSVASYVKRYDLLEGLKKNGIFVLNTVWTDEELEQKLPNSFKRIIAEKEIQFYTINANKLAREVGLGHRSNTILQTVFFKLTNILPIEEAIQKMKEAAHKAYAKKSQAIVEKNWAAIDQALENLHKVDVPNAWLQAKQESLSILSDKEKENSYLREVFEPVTRLKGDRITTKTLFTLDMTDGSIPTGTTQYEKRGIATHVPKWLAKECIMCNECSFVCPHAAIRPFLVDEKEMSKAPDSFVTREFRGAKGLSYRIQVDVEDCTGCGLCLKACPAKEKALEFQPYETQKRQTSNWEFALGLKEKANPIKRLSVLSSQFNQPLLEFSGACAGCGETPYVKLLTQLFGDRMMIANATGCSSIWGGSSPATPYTANSQGHGPAWSNSLLEDNAEFGFGMALAKKKKRQEAYQKAKKLLNHKDLPESVQNALKQWLEHFTDSDQTRKLAEKLEAELVKMAAQNPLASELYKMKDHFVKTSQWVIGGDGWAYDIGFGGLDHVIASGEDVNILVMDNEVYSNTGGQKSKATPAAAITKFASGGKYQAKKDLGMLAITYGNVYVAQIASGANAAQTLKAFQEAEKFSGPSLITCYTPCITHGLKGGMGNALDEAKRAVSSGYWSLYRYHPELAEVGKNPMTLDFKKPDFAQMEDFMHRQIRFSALAAHFPEKAKELFQKLTNDAKRRFINYAKLSGDFEKIQDKVFGE
ncbi:MAG: pyruvate:ferredoxin (flavodoxin) oxidoreductase [Streptococcaceae bacterium]|jgi:pyruvate-ferredoxin/flavodoxin oxidoreductase|nr:pyruvate:ferredoxin (flavodoxin) oxidoreductase [Streptococcaceae bacterium]